MIDNQGCGEKKKDWGGGGAIVEKGSRYGFFWHLVFQRSTLKN